MRIEFTTSTTLTKPGLTDQQARELRISGAPQGEYKIAVAKGDQMDVDDTKGQEWVRLGIAKEVGREPTAEELRQQATQDRTNSGQGAADGSDLNLPSELVPLATEAQLAVQRRLRPKPEPLPPESKPEPAAAQ